MSLDTLGVILLNVPEDRVLIENVTVTEAVLPGHLVEPVSFSGRKVATVRKNTVVATPLRLLVALNQAIQAGQTVDDTIASGGQLSLYELKPGDKVRLRLKTGTGQNAAAGDKLQLITGGMVSVTGENSVVVEAQEAVNAVSATTAPLITCVVL